MGVYNGFALIHHAARLRDKLGDDGLQLLAAFKVVFQLGQAARPLHKNVLIAVDHHLGDVRVRNDLAQYAQAPDRFIHRPGDLVPLPEIQGGQLPIGLRAVVPGPGQLGIQRPLDQRPHLAVVHGGQVRVAVDLLFQLADQVALCFFRHRRSAPFSLTGCIPPAPGIPPPDHLRLPWAG